MINIDLKDKCCGCYACFNTCPKECISMRMDDEGFCYPSIDKQLCINCRACEKVCPFLNNEKSSRTDVYNVYAARNKNYHEINISSSGGIFVLLANLVLEKGGVVYGAAFSETFSEVIHTAVTNKEQLKEIQTSKYVQSIIGKTYKECKTLLSAGRDVLFSGTPCQIDGLKNYLGKEYEKLICVEVVCHGVPSKLFWDKYLDGFKNKYGDLEYACFRSKKKSWEDFGMLLKFKKKEIFTIHKKNDFFLPFLNNMSLRPSCYSCKSKEHKSKADIILGDFWRIKAVEPNIYNKDGVSMVIINSVKGSLLFDSIKESIVFNKIDKSEIVNHKSAFRESPKRPADRNSYFKDLTNKSLRTTNKKYFHEPLSNRLKRTIKKLLKLQK